MLCSYSNDQSPHQVKIGYVERFCTLEKKFKAREILFAYAECSVHSKRSSGSPYVLHLNRGGTLEYFASIMDETKRKEISEYMDECSLFRQYKINGFNEPRVHVLLSSNAVEQQARKVEILEGEQAPPPSHSMNDYETPGPGYRYHGVRMKSIPLSNAEVIESLAEDLAKKFNIKQWNIGVDMIVYRNGNDRIGWHADDTQGEDIILTTVVETDGRRSVMIRPKKSKDEVYQNGDERIELIVEQGSAYKMDSVMQQHYEHSLPKVHKCESKRKVLVFRHGLTKSCKDNGKQISSDAIPCQNRVWYGDPTRESGIIPCSLLSREQLYESNVHANLLGGVCGNKDDGCSSIVISDEFSDRNEYDFFNNFSYSATNRQGSKSLVTSYNAGNPIRVFRSSKKSKYAPPSGKKATTYRYDGLYRIEKSSTLKDKDGGVYSTFVFSRISNALTLPRVVDRTPTSFDDSVYAAIMLLQLGGKKKSPDRNRTTASDVFNSNFQSNSNHNYAIDCNSNSNLVKNCFKVPSGVLYFKSNTIFANPGLQHCNFKKINA